MLTTTVEIPSGVTEFYNRTLLERALPYMNHDLFGQIRPLPQEQTDAELHRAGDDVAPFIARVLPGLDVLLVVVDPEAVDGAVASFAQIAERDVL